MLQRAPETTIFSSGALLARAVLYDFIMRKKRRTRWEDKMNVGVFYVIWDIFF